MTFGSTVIDTPIERTQKLFNLNIISYYAMAKQVLPYMIEKDHFNFSFFFFFYYIFEYIYLLKYYKYLR